MTEIAMPSLAEGMEQGTIVAWLVEPGAEVSIGDELVEIETDKAAMAYAAEASGYIEIVAEPGETLPVGAVIARLSASPPSTSGEGSVAPASQVGEAAPSTDIDAFPQAADPAPSVASAAVHEQGAIAATPLARRMAASLGVQLSTLTGTGPRGRITRSDVARHAGLPVPESPQRPVHNGASTAHQSSAAAASNGGAERATRRSMSRLQQTIARRMAESKATIPHFQVQAELKADALLKLRAQLKEEATLDPPPSINDFIVKATALALRDFPLANGAFRDGEFELHERINVGVAVAAQDALVVPVIIGADTRSVVDIATESRRLAERVRDGSVTPPELAGGTFTVSNLGMFGMTAIFPVINPGQAAILGVGASRRVPILRGDELAEQQLLTLTLSCDHRILYGAEAARFLSRVVAILERPLQLLM